VKKVIKLRMEKKCTGCGESKLLSEYYNKKTGKYGRKAKCKVCVKAYKKAYRESEAGKEKRKAYEQSEKWKAYRESEAGKAKRRAAQKKYRQTEKGKATDKKYNQSEAGKAYMKAYMKNRRHNDPIFKLHHLLSSGFYNWIKGNRKTCRTEQYVGCTYNELLDHLESQFEEGMTWENQGEWHIDHFKAQSRFDPTIEEEAFKCWHYTNLQPMWAEINIGWKDKKKPGDENRIWMDRKIGWVVLNV
jgi:hypothetical protein